MQEMFAQNIAMEEKEFTEMHHAKIVQIRTLQMKVIIVSISTLLQYNFFK